MDEKELQQIAAQLRKPEGEIGFKTGEWMNKGNVQINLNAIEALQVSSGDQILEIGMGNGFFVKEILGVQPDVIYTGCDFSDVMVEAATTMNADWVAADRAKFIHADLSALPFSAGAFDKIFSVNTIYFWENDTQALGEIKRVLKPDGKLVLALRPKHQMERYPFTKYGFRMLSKEELFQLLENHGFTIAELFENPEPDFELNGVLLKMENLIVTATLKLHV
ncbi:MAG: class I SAM-dependent methyltransferase [Bacteroidota bacterium]